MHGSRRGTAAALALVVVLGVGTSAVAQTSSHGPSVRSLSARSGSTSGGTRVVIHGSHFIHVTAVRFGGLSGRAVSVTSSTRLTVLTPTHSAGVVDVRIVTRSGTSRTHPADRFAFVAPPRVSALSPNGGLPSGGTRVTIRGAHFTRSSAVRFGTTAGTSSRLVSTTELQVTAPAHAQGAVDVRVSNSYGRSTITTADRYTYTDAPAPVSDLTVADATTTTITLRWLPWASTGGIMIRRTTGATAPASPAAGTLVAKVPATTRSFVDSGLTPVTTYSYTVFAYTSAGPVYSSASTITASTPLNSRPDIPTQLGTTPAIAGDSGNCLTTPYGALSGGTTDVIFGARISDPDGQQVDGWFHVWDLGTNGSQDPVDVVGFADAAGHSQQVFGSGYVTVRIPSDDFTADHLYGFAAVANDGSAQSATSAPCYFWYAPEAPLEPTITPAQTTYRVGDHPQFTFSAVDVSTTSGGVDHFAYTVGDPSALESESGGVHVPAVMSGNTATAAVSFAVTAWGETSLYVRAWDKTGTASPIATLQFYVADS